MYSWKGFAMKLAVTFIFLLVATGAGTLAQKQKQPEPCADMQTQAEMNICWGNQYKAADAQLNKTYQKLVARLDAEEKAQLRNVEATWLKYRDANCEFVADQYKGGSIRPMIYAMCMADMTTNRTTELKHQIEDRNQ
jgi:uncharacterized protein YecT (DUF1311 family)